MSYTAPPGDAVNFTFEGPSYTAPAGDAVDFDFTSSATLTCAGAVVLNGAATLSHGVALTGAGMLSLDGWAAFVAAAATRRLNVYGAVKLGGQARLNAGSVFAASGTLRLSGGAAQFRLGRKITFSGDVRLGGQATLAHYHAHAFTGAGQVTFGGRGGFVIPSHPPLPSMYIKTLRTEELYVLG